MDYGWCWWSQADDSSLLYPPIQEEMRIWRNIDWGPTMYVWWQFHPLGWLTMEMGTGCPRGKMKPLSGIIFILSINFSSSSSVGSSKSEPFLYIFYEFRLQFIYWHVLKIIFILPIFKVYGLLQRWHKHEGTSQGEKVSNLNNFKILCWTGIVTSILYIPTKGPFITSHSMPFTLNNT